MPFGCEKYVKILVLGLAWNYYLLPGCYEIIFCKKLGCEKGQIGQIQEYPYESRRPWDWCGGELEGFELRIGVSSARHRIYCRIIKFYICTAELEQSEHFLIKFCPMAKSYKELSKFIHSNYLLPLGDFARTIRILANFAFYLSFPTGWINRSASPQKETQILSTFCWVLTHQIFGFCRDSEWILCFQTQNDKFHNLKWENLNKSQKFANILIVPEFVQSLRFCQWQ